MKIKAILSSQNPYVDTDVIIRFLTSDDPKKQKACSSLFEKVEQNKLTLTAPDTVIADAVFVLSSPRLYNLQRTEIRDILSSLLRISNFKVENKQALLSALDLYAVKNIDFSDAFLVSLVLQTKEKVLISYNHDFDKIQGIKRIEP